MSSSHSLVGESPSFRRALALIDRIARFDVPVVIEGETGTGKELAARAIHYGSARRDQPFVPVNCGAIPDTLIENELFGHQRGAFTDARADATGLVELAHGGTLFLDEVDALSSRAQVALLRFLQDQSFRPLGSRQERRVDVRVVAASNRPLHSLADGGAFRSDLLFRLRVMVVELPPLRTREGDASLLARHFVDTLNRRYPLEPKRLSAEFDAWIVSQPWPGNVRELENVVHRQYLITSGPEVVPPGPSVEPAPRAVPSRAAAGSRAYRAAKAAAVAEFDRAFLSELLRATDGSVSAAARLASKERRALGKLLRKYGLRATDYRSA